MKSVILSLLLILLFTSSLINSAPLKFVPQKLNQPDGEIINCFASGDEYFNWLHDKDGYTILQNENGYYVYAVKKDGLLIPTKNIVGKSSPDLLRMQKWLIPDKKYINEKVKSLLENKRQLKNQLNNYSAVSAPVKGTLNNLIIFIRFSDEHEFTENPENLYSMFNSESSTENSLYNYYNEVSYGQLKINSKFYPVSDNSYIKSYQDGNPRNYYKAFSVTNQIGYKNGIEKTEREHNLLTNAINAIKNNIPGAEDLDADNDGNVDNISFIVKGSPEVWSNLLWPHMSSLDSKNIFINGKKATTYNFQLVENLLQTGVGVLCHEMFHSLGAPDLYHYSGDGITPVGEWDLMENTTNPPQHMGAYMKYRYGKWINSIPEISDTGSYQLSPLASSGNNCFKIASPNSGSEYFVLEYRKKIGVFERSLPSDGLLVYRINTAYEGQGNAFSTSDEVYIYRPGGDIDNNGIPDSAGFSKNSGRTIVNDFSDPAPFLSSGLPGGLNLYDISFTGDNINFKVAMARTYKIALTSPNGGENIKINNETLITWSNTSVSDIKIEFTADGIHWDLVETLTGQSGIYSGKYLWKTPSFTAEKAKIRISDLNDPGNYSISKNYFNISANGRLFELEPNNSTFEATPISIGDTYEGEINPEGDADYYKFTAAAGDTIDIFASAKNSALFGRIQVLNDSGFITYDDGIYKNVRTSQRLSVLIPESGVYYIRYAFVENWGSNSPVKATPGKNLNNESISSANLTGKYQILLDKFKPSSPDFGFGGAWKLAQNSAMLYWDVQENGCLSDYMFEYGTTNYYGNQVNERKVSSLPLYQSNSIMTPTIFGLLPDTKYHFRIVAVNKFGTFYSKDNTFTTAKVPDNWERQLIDWEGSILKYFSFNESEGIAVTNGDLSGPGLFKTTNGGRTWSPKIDFPNGLNLEGASFINKNYGWIVGNKIYKTTDGGITWTEQNNPTAKYLTSVCFVDENNGWAAGYQGVIINTKDGGKNWNVQETGNLPGMWERLFDIDFYDINCGITVGTSGTILKTTNGGVNWTKQQSGTLATINGVHILSPLIATALGDGPCGGPGNILHTTNGGASWVNQNNPTGNYLYGVDFLDADNGLGVGINGSIAKTTDGGNTWIEQESGTRSVLRDVKMINLSKAVIVGDWGVILKSKDVSSKSVIIKSPAGGEVLGFGSVKNITWQKNNIDKINILFSTNNNENWDTIAVNVPASFNSYQWLIPNTASGICKIKLLDTDDHSVFDQNITPFSITNNLVPVEAGAALPSVYGLSQNYPNPFNPNTAINYQLPVQSHVYLKIYDILGREVTTLVNEEKSAGYYKINFNAGMLSSGIYFYRIQAVPAGSQGGGFTDTRKFILMK